MAPIKLEEQIKETLEKRQLKPSASAWERLSEKLDAEAPANNKTNWWWLGIAASVIGILTIVIMSKDDSSLQTTPVIVDSPQKVIELDASQNTQGDFVESESPTKPVDTNKNRIIEKTAGKLVEVNKSEPKLNNNNSVKEVVNTPTETITDVSFEPNNDNTILHKEQVKTLTLEQQKIQEVAVKIKQLQQNNSMITEAEIETLLVEAQRELNLKKSFNENTNTVDAMLLLQDVEFELDKSFRDKVFETLESGYVIVKNAVKDRGNN